MRFYFRLSRHDAGYAASDNHLFGAINTGEEHEFALEQP